MRGGRRLLLGLLLTAGCASAPRAGPDAPALFVVDPVDLLPDLGAVLCVNVPRLRQEGQLWGQLVERMARTEEAEGDRAQIRLFAQHTETLLLGMAHPAGEDPDILMVLRTQGVKLVSPEGQVLGAETTLGQDGLRRGKLGEDDLVLVDEFTAVVFEPGLRGAMEAILSRQPGLRFRERPAFRGLAREVGFGQAPVALLGALPPGAVDKLLEKTPPGMRPLARAMRGVEVYGGQLEVGPRYDLKVSLRGASANDMGVLAGVLLLLKGAGMDSQEDSDFAELARNLEVELKEEVLTLRYSMTREAVWRRLEAWLDDLGREEAPEEAPAAQEI